MREKGDTVKRVKYDEGFEYGRKVGSTMSPSRRTDNVRMVQESDYFQPESPTSDYWHGFVDGLLSF